MNAELHYDTADLERLALADASRKLAPLLEAGFRLTAKLSYLNAGVDITAAPESPTPTAAVPAEYEAA